MRFFNRLSTEQKNVLMILGIILLIVLLYTIYDNLMKSYQHPAEQKQVKFKDEPQIKYIDNTNNKTKLDIPNTSNDVKYMVLFYAPWCGGCKSVKPIWDEIEQNYNGTNGTQMVKLNGDEQRDLFDKHGVSSIPSIKIMYGSIETPKKVVDYKGDRSFDDIVNFMNTN